MVGNLHAIFLYYKLKTWQSDTRVSLQTVFFFFLTPHPPAFFLNFQTFSLRPQPTLTQMTLLKAMNQISCSSLWSHNTLLTASFTCAVVTCVLTLMCEIRFLFNECSYNASLSKCVKYMKVLRNIIFTWTTILTPVFPFHQREHAQKHTSTHTPISLPHYFLS